MLSTLPVSNFQDTLGLKTSVNGSGKWPESVNLLHKFSHSLTPSAYSPSVAFSAQLVRRNLMHLWATSVVSLFRLLPVPCVTRQGEEGSWRLVVGMKAAHVVLEVLSPRER